MRENQESMMCGIKIKVLFWYGSGELGLSHILFENHLAQVLIRSYAVQILIEENEIK